MKSQKAFTLIELLVVIAIIGILASVIVASVNSAREKGRIAAIRNFEEQVDHIAGEQLVGKWDFDECSGSVARDMSGYGNNGVLAGVPIGSIPTWSPDTPSGQGCSLSFDLAYNQLVAVTNNTMMDIGTGSVTRAFWFKTSQTVRAIFFRKSGGGTHNGMTIDTAGTGTGQVDCYMHDTPEVRTTTPQSYTDGKWHHLACVFDRDTNLLNLYMDGSLKASANASALSGINMLSGSDVWFPSSPYLTGLLDSVHIFAKALTASEVGKLYAEGLRAQNFAENK